MSLVGRVLGGRYKIERHLADGGMGSIWRAEDLTLAVPVAVKLMSVEGAMRADLRARFDREARAVALLRNPHVVQVLDHGADGDTPFIVMELLEGVDLLATQKSSPGWPLSEIAELVSQVAQGLGAAHRAGLIHRDVKPANIFLARAAPGGSPAGDREEIVAKVIDFGIAKWADNKEVLTGTNVILGSPSFMSPEQIRGQRVDARVDAWALAVVAFALVTGNMPFVGKSGPDIARQVVLGKRQAMPPGTPNALAFERFFARAFAHDLGARHGSVEELAGEFILAADVPSPLRSAARAVAEARRDPGDQCETRKLPAFGGDDSVTNVLARASQSQALSPGDFTADALAANPDLEETETDDRLIPSAGAANRTRSSG